MVIVGIISTYFSGCGMVVGIMVVVVILMMMIVAAVDTMVVMMSKYLRARAFVYMLHLSNLFE